MGFAEVGAEVGHRDPEGAGQVAGAARQRSVVAGGGPSVARGRQAVDDLPGADQDRRPLLGGAGHHVRAVVAMDAVDVQASGRPVHDLRAGGTPVRV